MAFTMDSTLNDILNDPKAVEVMNKYAPGISTNPMVGMVKGMSLNQILSMPQAAQFGLTKEKVEAMVAEINKVV